LVNDVLETNRSADFPRLLTLAAVSHRSVASSVSFATRQIFSLHAKMLALRRGLHPTSEMGDYLRMGAPPRTVAGDMPVPSNGRRPNERPRISRFLRRLFVWFYLPLALILIALHFPYDTDASPVRETKSATSFYEQAYRPTDSSVRGIDYEKTAAEAAAKYNIEGQVRGFVTRHGLQNKKVLEVGSGRGYLQDIVVDYTGLDLSPAVAPNYHKPFVVGSATAMPFSDSSFDAAWTVWVLEHISTPQKALEEMRRVVKPGGVMLLIVAWNCQPWFAEGFEVRPYSDFNLAGKVVKASIPVRSSILFSLGHLVPIRMVRLVQYSLLGESTRLRFRGLNPNYDAYWQPDSDAAVSLDLFETLLWFQSRGDSCINCRSVPADLVALGKPIVIRVNKSS
jgi:SAM-dependent methyltransferase